MTQDTINILKSLLRGLTINPFDPGAPEDLEKLRKAMSELEEIEKGLLDQSE